MSSIGSTGGSAAAHVQQAGATSATQAASGTAAPAEAPAAEGAPGAQQARRVPTGQFLQDAIQDRIAARLLKADGGEKKAINLKDFKVMVDKDRYEASGGAFLEVQGMDVMVTVDDRGVGAKGFVAQRYDEGKGTFEGAPTIPIDMDPSVVTKKLEDMHAVHGGVPGDPVAYAITSFDRVSAKKDYADFRHLVAIHVDESGLKVKDASDPLKGPMDRMFAASGGYAKIEGLAVSDKGNQIFVGLREKGAAFDPVTNPMPWTKAKKTVEVYGLDMKADPNDPGQPRPVFKIDTKALGAKHEEGLSGLFMDEKNNRMLVLTSVELEDGTVGGSLYEVDRAELEKGMKRNLSDGPLNLTGPPLARVLAKFDEKPEGITQNPKTGDWIVTFDLDDVGQKKIFGAENYGTEEAPGRGQRASIAAVFPEGDLAPLR